MLSVIILSVIMLSVIILRVIMLSVIMLSVIMLSVIMLSVIMLIVVAPVDTLVCALFTEMQRIHLLSTKNVLAPIFWCNLHLLVS